MKCPKCSVKLIVKEKLDITLRPTGAVIDVAGQCFMCGTKYLWTQRYDLSEEYALEKDED